MNKINVAIADDNQRTVEMMTELLEQERDVYKRQVCKR